MNKLTIMLFIIAIICSGVGGFVLGAQNAQMVPAINVANNTTDDSSYVAPKYTNTTKYKTNTSYKQTYTPTETNTPTQTTPTQTTTPTNPTEPTTPSGNKT